MTDPISLEAIEAEMILARLLDVAEHDWRVSFLAHTSDTAKDAADTIRQLIARVRTAEADVERLAVEKNQVAIEALDQRNRATAAEARADGLASERDELRRMNNLHRGLWIGAEEELKALKSPPTEGWQSALDRAKAEFRKWCISTGTLKPDSSAYIEAESFFDDLVAYSRAALKVMPNE